MDRSNKHNNAGYILKLTQIMRFGKQKITLHYHCSTALEWDYGERGQVCSNTVIYADRLAGLPFPAMR